MIHDPANPLNYKLPEPKINVGIDLPKSQHACRLCGNEYEPWVFVRNKWVMLRECDECRSENANSR